MKFFQAELSLAVGSAVGTMGLIAPGWWRIALIFCAAGCVGNAISHFIRASKTDV